MKPQPENAGQLCPICDNDWLCEHGLCNDTGTPWTRGCAGSYGEDGYQCQDCAEAQQEERFAEYWGGESVSCEHWRDRWAREKREKDGILP